jgi:hypothetical protein
MSRERSPVVDVGSLHRIAPADRLEDSERPFPDGRIEMSTYTNHQVYRVVLTVCLATWLLLPGCANMPATPETQETPETNTGAVLPQPQDPCEGVTCREDEVCDAGSCIQLDPCDGITCGSGRSCVEGECVECMVDADCDDGLLCTTDSCIDGECSARERDCDDTNLATFDLCVPASGCINIPLIDLPTGVGAFCTNHDACGDGEFCVTGRCTAVNLCDGISCQEGETCMDGLCVASNSSDPCEGLVCGFDRICEDGACFASNPAEQVELSDLTDYSEDFAVLPMQIDGNCTTTGICDAGDELGILTFIRIGTGATSETRYYSSETEEFVALVEGTEPTADSIECWDEDIVFDMCELEQDQKQPLLEGNAHGGGPSGETALCGGTAYNPAQECCDHRTGEFMEGSPCSYTIADGASPDCKVEIGKNCNPANLEGVDATTKPENPGGYGSNNFFWAAGCGQYDHTVRWGCDECIRFRKCADSDGGDGPCCTQASDNDNQRAECASQPGCIECDPYEHCVPEPTCEEAAAASVAGDLDAPALQLLAGNWHDLCYQICGNSKTYCDDGGYDRWIASCDDAYQQGKLDEKCHKKCKSRAKVFRVGLKNNPSSRKAYKYAQEHCSTEDGNIPCCENVYRESTGILNYNEKQGCFQIDSEGAKFQPIGLPPEFEELAMTDSVGVRFEWYPVQTQEIGCGDESTDIHINAMEELGAIYPIMNSSGWDAEHYFSTIRTEAVGPDQDDDNLSLLARGSGGVISHMLDTGTKIWSQVAGTYPIMDTPGWNDRQYISTIRTAVVDDDVYVLARGSGGVVSHKLDTESKTWSQVAGTYPIMNSSGWDAEHYISTIRIAVVDDDIYLLARGSGGIISHKLDTESKTWSQVAGTYPIMNSSGWDAEHYISTIRTEVVGTNIFLLARGSGGVISHKLATSTGSSPAEWSQVAGTYPIMNSSGWDAEHYISTIRTAVVDDDILLTARAYAGIVTYALRTKDGFWEQVHP